MRGKVGFDPDHILPWGITPACAGKSAWHCIRNTVGKDHPRVCGEKRPPGSWLKTPTGSPPRVRGKGRHQLRDCIDHPRVCGEKLLYLCIGSGHTGSPPRVRGKVTSSNNITRGQRITPACAGKSLRPWSGTCGVRDHPRVCGEKAQSCVETGNFAGSPPRVRGKAGDQCQTLWPQGITPACAGKRTERTPRRR